MEIAIDKLQILDKDMDDLKQLKSVGLSHLENNNFKEAVNVYKKIVSEYPEDVESFLLLGDLYLANEDYPSAEKLYQKALSLEPENEIIQRRVKLSSFELTTHSTEEIPTDAASVSKMLQDITGRPTPVTEEEILSAAKLLESIVHSQNPAEIVAKNLEQIDTLLPALIELNIRQARNDRRFDLVNMLQALKESIEVLKVDSNETTAASIGKDLQNQSTEISALKNVVFLVPDKEIKSERMLAFEKMLEKKGVNVFYSDQEPNIILENIDLIITFNAHKNPAIVEIMASYSAQHIPLVLDLDDDFEYMPINHPDYTTAGLGSLEKSRSYTAALLFANLITVPGESMASHIRETGYKVEVIPFGWSKNNSQWTKPKLTRSSVNIGLIGIQGNFEDVQQYRRIIIRIMREFQQTRLVVCGDPITYKLFENISENRRVFLPCVPHEEMSYILSQIDVLLIPLNSTPYHLVSTDRILMQAGVKGIPWIASPMPDFNLWQAGGVAAETPDEWHSYLRQFIQDRDLRNSLGEAGKKHALLREDEIIGDKWFALINQLVLDHKKS
jgi:tetratricopeptide (TPR) repeat protein